VECMETMQAPMRTMAGQMDTPKLTVGYDGSDGAVAALRWASSESLHRGGTLQVLTCPDESNHTTAIDRLLPDPRPVYEMAEWLLQSQSGHDPARQTEFTFSIMRGPAERRLAAESTSSDLLVIGTAGHLLLGAWRLGSIAHEILRHAVCPVVLVPVGYLPAEHHRIVVGVEDVTSRAALTWAAREATRRHSELVIVHAQHPDQDVTSQGQNREAGHCPASILCEAVRFAAQHCDTQISTRLITGPAATSLLEQSFNADLLVVGARTSGHGDDKPGSIARAVGACATIPTVIVQNAPKQIDHLWPQS